MTSYQSEELQQIINNAEKIVFFSGAGILLKPSFHIPFSFKIQKNSIASIKIKCFI